MSKIFDKIIIGSGPSSLGYLWGLKKDYKNKLLITNNAKKINNLNNYKFHPKLYNKNKLFINPESKIFGETNAKGGLSLAWGGVLSTPSLEDIKKYTKYSRNYKKLYLAYQKILINFCKNFKVNEFSNFNSRLVNISDIKKKKFNNFNNEKFYSISNYLKSAWENSKLSLFPLIKKECKKLSFRIKTDNVLSIKKNNNIWIIKCDKNVYFSKKIILSAGAISNRKILIFLDKKFQKIQLYDNVPNKIYAINFSNKKIKLNNFFLLPFIYLQKKNLLYAFYCIGQLSLSFLKKNGIIGFLISILPKLIRNNLYFIQQWQKNNNISLYSQKKIFVKRINYFKIIKSLFKLGFLTILINKTKKGEGFHYMTLTKQHKINPILKKHRNLTVLGGFCNNFSIYEHPTLSFMADAYLKAKKHIF
jgi:hypothetical protein